MCRNYVITSSNVCSKIWVVFFVFFFFNFWKFKLKTLSNFEGFNDSCPINIYIPRNTSPGLSVTPAVFYLHWLCLEKHVLQHRLRALLGSQDLSYSRAPCCSTALQNNAEAAATSQQGVRDAVFWERKRPITTLDYIFVSKISATNELTSSQQLSNVHLKQLKRINSRIFGSELTAFVAQSISSNFLPNIVKEKHVYTVKLSMLCWWIFCAAAMWPKTLLQAITLIYGTVVLRKSFTRGLSKEKKKSTATVSSRSGSN